MFCFRVKSIGMVKEGFYFLVVGLVYNKEYWDSRLLNFLVGMIVVVFCRS